MGFVTGALRFHLEAWKSITSDTYLLTVVQGCRVEFIGAPPINTIPKQYPMSSDLSSQISVEIQTMLKKGIIREFEPNESMVLSPIFTRVKKSGKLRIILDIKELNKLVPYNHFKNIIHGLRKYNY